MAEEYITMCQTGFYSGFQTMMKIFNLIDAATASLHSFYIKIYFQHRDTKSAVDQGSLKGKWQRVIKIISIKY
jgi:hypothetical protein